MNTVMKIVVTLDVPGRCAIRIALSPRSNGDKKKDLSKVTTVLKVKNVDLNDRTSTLGMSLFPSVMTSAPFVLRLFGTRIAALSNRISAAFMTCLSRRGTP